jgi:hypothetical protein
MGVLDYFRPGWKHSDPAVRLAAACAADVDVARQMCVHDPNPEVRRAAGKRLQECLRQIALDHHEPVGRRVEAAAGLTDVTALVEVVRQSSDDVAVAAVSSVDDPLVLSEIDNGICGGRSTELPKAVVDAILRQLKTDQARASLARRSESSTIGTWVVGMISDQTLLLDLARHSANSCVRLSAMSRLAQPSDVEMLSAATTDVSASVRAYALGRVSAAALAQAYFNADSSIQRQRLAAAIANPHPSAVPSQKENDARVLSAIALDESLALETRGRALRRLPAPASTDALKTILVTLTSDDERQALVLYAVGKGSSWCPKCGDVVRTIENGWKDVLCSACGGTLWQGPTPV